MSSECVCMCIYQMRENVICAQYEIEVSEKQLFQDSGVRSTCCSGNRTEAKEWGEQLYSQTIGDLAIH